MQHVALLDWCGARRHSLQRVALRAMANERNAASTDLAPEEEPRPPQRRSVRVVATDDPGRAQERPSRREEGQPSGGDRRRPERRAEGGQRRNERRPRSEGDQQGGSRQHESHRRREDDESGRRQDLREDARRRVDGPKQGQHGQPSGRSPGRVLAEPSRRSDKPPRRQPRPPTPPRKVPCEKISRGTWWFCACCYGYLCVKIPCGTQEYECHAYGHGNLLCRDTKGSGQHLQVTAPKNGSGRKRTTVPKDGSGRKRYEPATVPKDGSGRREYDKQRAAVRRPLAALRKMLCKRISRGAWCSLFCCCVCVCFSVEISYGTQKNECLAVDYGNSRSKDA